MFGNCTETVSILYAMVLGADDACVSLSISSILAALAAFFVLVLIAQFLARRLWAKVLPRASHKTLSDGFEDADEDRPFSDDPNYRDSAIRSVRR